MQTDSTGFSRRRKGICTKRIDALTAIHGLIGCSAGQVSDASVVLIVIHHTSKACFAKFLYIRRDARVCRMLIAKEPPCLHLVVVGWVLPQLFQRLRMNCDKRA